MNEIGINGEDLTLQQVAYCARKGTQVMTAIGALVVYDSIRLAKLADVAACMSLEVLQGSRVGTEPENS